MTTATSPTTFSQDGLHQLLDSREEPTWLRDMRTEAWDSFGEMNWPARNHEEWIRTDIRLFKLDKYRPLIEPLGEAPHSGALLADGVQLDGRVSSLDGRPQFSELAPKWAERGVIFGSLEQLVTQHSELVREHLFTVMDRQYDRFAALHAAFWGGGALLYVPRGVVVDRPLHLQSLLSHGGSDLSHTLVILEEGAEATLLCETGGAAYDADGFHCGGIEIVQRPGSNLRFVNLQDWGHKTWHFAHQKANVQRDAHLQWTVGALGARLAKVNQHVALTGKGATTQVNGTMFTEATQHIAYHTLQHHVAESCRSDFLYKAALQDKSRTVWRGMIKVDPSAQKTDGYQRNDNLLLSHQARADSIPGLEIEADDVRCTHGSTSGRVDEELIFYAQCRGFTRREAIRAIVTGFFQKVFDRITIDSVREALAHAIARRVREYE